MLDSTNEQLAANVRDDKAEIDIPRAGFYYSWLEVASSTSGNNIYLPPSNFVCGICARNDIERGIHNAPANKVVRLARNVEFRINKSQQEVLKPESIHVLRFFERHGVGVRRARTCGSSPQWKYINVWRYFAFLERSLERDTH